MRYHLITARYDGQNISLYARDETGKKKRVIATGFRYYFFVPENQPVPDDPSVVGIEHGFESIEGVSLKKIIMKTPADVKRFRNNFQECYEADIPSPRRFLIDTRIRNGFEAGKEVVNYQDLRPVDSSYSPHICYLDIEVNCHTRFPNPAREDEKIICVTLWDNRHRKYITILLGEGEGELDHRQTLIKTTCEVNLLTILKRYLEWIDPDVLVGWNISFDVDYIRERCKRYNLRIDFDRMNVFDLFQGYSNIYKRGGNRLKEVARREGLTNEETVEEFHSEWWGRDNTRLIEYNRKDVEYCVKLDKKFKLTEFYWALKNYAGLEDLQGALYHGVLVETLLLRDYRNKWVTRSRPKEREGKKLGGALTTWFGEPARGLYENVFVFDVSRYYPMILINFNLSPEPHDSTGVIPSLGERLLKERDKYDRTLKEMKAGTPEYQDLKQKRNCVKYISESLVGILGQQTGRFYYPELFEKITRTGREGLTHLQQVALRHGAKVLYADTDGIFVQVEPSQVQELEGILNEGLREFCRKKGMKENLRIKIDRYFKRVLFTGVKKRYAGWVVEEAGTPCDYIHVAGFESVRRDTSEVTRRLQKEVFELLLRGKKGEIAGIIRNTIKDMRAGKYSLNDVAIPKTLSKPLTGYKTSIDYVRGSLYANKHFGLDIREGDMVRMLYVRRVPGYPHTDVVCFLDESQLPVRPEIDWDKMISRTIRMKLEEIIELGGISWSQIEGNRTLLELTSKSLRETFS